MDVRTSLAQAAYNTARKSTPNQAEAAASPDLKAMAKDFAATVQRGEQTAQTALTSGADPHALVTALAETSLAVETAVTVRDKVVEAYQEILRMPV